MSTNELRREIKKAINQVPAERLESLADYVQFLSRPSLAQRVEEAEKAIDEGKEPNGRQIRRDVAVQSSSQALS
jgi:hypothetical protein